MNISIHVDIDLRSPRWMRRLLILGVPVAAMLATSVVSGAPQTFEKDEPLSAAKMNANFKDLSDRSATDWQPYSCKLVDGTTGVDVGVNTTSCKARQVNDTLEVRAATVFTAAPPGGKQLAWTLPPGNIVDTKLALPGTDHNVVGVVLAGIGGNLAGVVLVNPGKNSVIIATHEAPGPNYSTGIAAGAAISLSFSVPFAPE